tara:strand:+ start:70 stop:465 length:396 start_codon:yes stop_codon:yes gene_type:complete
MSNYTKSTNFATKDNLAAGNALKRVKGAEIDDEFNALSVSIATKANSNNTALTGVPVAPTASAATNSTQLATTAYVTTSTAGALAAVAAIPDSGIVSVIVDGAAGAIGKSIYINNAAPTTQGSNGDVWFEY